MTESLERIFERRPIALQVRLAIDDVGTFVDRYAINISEGGIFIRSREPRPVGSKLKFLLHLRNGDVVFSGEGTVRWVRTPEAAGAGLAGMGLQFDSLTDESRQVLSEIVRAREASRVPPPVEAALPQSWPPLETQTPHDTPFPPCVRKPEESPPVVTNRPGFTLGLELGWAHVRAAVVSERGAQSVALGRGGPMPAAIACAEGKLLVGDAAASAMYEGAPGIRGLAQLLGRWPDTSAVASWRRRQIAEPVTTPDGKLGVSLGGKVWPVRALLDALLLEVKARAEASLGGVVSRVVFAVPASWTDAQRHALREASERCHFPVEQFVSAPLAAVLALNESGKRRVLTVSFGAGAVEAALVTQHEHVFEQLGIAFDAELGGADFDMALVGALLSQFEKETGLLVPEDGAIFERTRATVEDAKRALSHALDFEVQVRGVAPAGLSRADLDQRITRAWLLSLISPQLDQAVDLCAATATAEFDEILLLGGQASFAPFVARLTERLGRAPIRPDDADELAAKGAALAADVGGYGKCLLAGTVSASVSVVASGKPSQRIIERNLPLPVERRWILTPAPGEQEVSLQLFQGESSQMPRNDYVGMLGIKGIPPQARVAIALGVDANGELGVSAKDASSGRDLSATLDRDRR